MSGDDPFIAIDFGTSTSSMAWFNPKTGQAEVLHNAEGDHKTPSVVYFGDKETIVGKHAEDMIDNVTDYKRLVVSVKRQLAKSVVFDVVERRVTSLEVAVEIIKKLKRDAESGSFHQEVTRAIITCPAVFDQLERGKIVEAGQRAGFREVELLEEPIAAAIAYAHAGLDVGRSVLVYDLGGGTFDLALLTQDDGGDFRLAIEPKGCRCGGDDLDLALYDHFEHLVQERINRPISTEGIDLLFLRDCRRRKEELSIRAECGFRSTPRELKQPVKMSLTRKYFEDLIGSKIEPTIRLTHDLLVEAQSAGFEVDSVVLIGGSSRVPLVERKLEEAIPKIRRLKWHQQDVAVALGAAYYAHHLWGKQLPPSVPDPPPAQQSVPGVSPGKDPSSESQTLFGEAERLLEEAEKLSNDKSEEKQLRRRQYIGAALHRAQAVCDLEPNWPNAFYLKGSVLWVGEEWLVAAATYTAFLRMVPDSAQAYFARATCKLMAGDNEGARDDFTDAIRLAPEEIAYRCRAAAFLRLKDAAAGLADIEAAIARAGPDTPLAGLHAAAGFLLIDEFRAPNIAVDSFSKALKALPHSIGPIEQSHFSSVCQFLGVADRVTIDPSLQLARASLGNPVLALLKFSLTGRLDGRIQADRAPTRPEDSTEQPVFFLQTALWLTCKMVYGSSARAAVNLFQINNSWPVDEALLKSDPSIALHSASLAAQKKESAKVIFWLGALLRVQPGFDICVAMRDNAISQFQDPNLQDFFRPKWTYQEEHGVFTNYLAVTNESPYRLTSIGVTAEVIRKDGKQTPPISCRLDSLDAGKSHRWDNVFPEAGFFGGNIFRIHVYLFCAESSAGQQQSVGSG